MRKRYFNGLKTMGLFVALWVLLLGFGAVVGNGRYLWIFGLCALGTSLWAMWRSDKSVIRAMHARPVTEVEQPAMYRIVRQLSQEAGQPMPRLYVSPTAAPNAFATGRNPRNSAVCCTTGILQLLDERELRGVLGHELMHVYNRDILIGSVAAAFAGIITGAAQMMFIFGGGGNRNANPLALIGMLVLAPIAATVIRFTITRTREFDADESGAELTGDPQALASALRKLERGVAARPLAASNQLENVSHLMIANPFRSAGLAKLFTTHPPMDERIERLEEMAQHRGFLR